MEYKKRVKKMKYPKHTGIVIAIFLYILTAYSFITGRTLPESTAPIGAHITGFTIAGLVLLFFAWAILKSQD